jgi:hypothetical protein
MIIRIQRAIAEGRRNIGPLLGLAVGVALANGCSESMFEPTPSGPSNSGDDGGLIDPGIVGSSSVHPVFGPTLTASVPPPPISGGTLLVTHGGHTVVAADPDRDAVYVVNVSSHSVAFTIALQKGDQPGRLVEDRAGRVHVALRGGGALVTIDPTRGAVVSRRIVCPAPRGVAWDASSDLVWVACATGELVALPAAGGGVTRTLVLERDLRDVIVGNGSLTVTQFRSAQVLRLTSDGTITRRDPLPSPVSTFAPHVAWRAIAAPSGALVAVHQAESRTSLSTQVQGGYGAPSDPGGSLGSESGAVISVLTVLGHDGAATVNQPFPGVLSVDVAMSPDGSAVAVVAPGNAFVPALANVYYFAKGGAAQPLPLIVGTNEQPIAVAFDSANHLLVQTREPARLWILSLPVGGAGTDPTSIPLSKASRDDSGHKVFHTEAGGMIACASCHPEGGDDGHVWSLDGQPRRTPSLRGTIAGTAPYHWPGDEPSLKVLVDDVYSRRMNGASLDGTQMGALTTWLQGLPAPPAPSWVDGASAQRGQDIFQRADVGCATCHAGPKLTNNATMDVGTGGAFQVPPLVGVGWRTPLLHDGCAATLEDRFGRCATSGHGAIASLSAQDISDLTAYLETL